eukprot:TRINITY_DN213_c2_g1_i1.p1 TRINITY_DN213_c2_g1~~TRINITY_DN213_c2_g1_i1.p1  ORF type:complete len:311 (+),score=16.80 TRINITY_DN213_c2_g1_i1:111-1043(+)
MISFEDYFNDIKVMTHPSHDSQNKVSLASLGFSIMKAPVEVVLGKGHHGARVDMSRILGTESTVAEIVSTEGGYHCSLDVGHTISSLKLHNNINWEKNGGETSSLRNSVSLGNITCCLSSYIDPTTVRSGKIFQSIHPSYGTISASMGNFKIGSKVRDRFIHDYGILYEAKKRTLVRLPEYCRPLGLNKLTVALAFGDGNNGHSASCRGVGIAGLGFPLPNPRIGIKGEFKSLAVAAYVENDELSAAIGFSPLSDVPSNLTTRMTVSPSRVSTGIQAAVLSRRSSVSISIDLPSVQQPSLPVVGFQLNFA